MSFMQRLGKRPDGVLSLKAFAQLSQRHLALLSLHALASPGDDFVKKVGHEVFYLSMLSLTSPASPAPVRDQGCRWPSDRPHEGSLSYADSSGSRNESTPRHSRRRLPEKRPAVPQARASKSWRSDRPFHPLD